MSELLNLQFTFSRLLPRLLDEAHRLGYSITLGEAYRTPEQAKINAERGTGIGPSLHCSRLAIDLQLFREGRYLDTTEQYLALGEFWEKLGLESSPPVPTAWGGRFQSRPDGNHFSIGYQGVR